MECFAKASEEYRKSFSSQLKQATQKCDLLENERFELQQNKKLNEIQYEYL